jgi:hypothetical protein
VDEVDDRLAFVLVGLIGVDQQVRRRRDRICALGVRVEDVGLRRDRELQGVTGCGDRLHRRRHVGAVLPLHLRDAEVRRHGEVVGHVADRAFRLRDRRGDSIVSVRARPGRPLDRLAGSDLLVPILALGGEPGGEHERRAGLVGAMDDLDRLVRQRHVGIELRDRRIVPRRDVAEEDVTGRRPIELEAAGKTRHVVAEDDTAEDGRDLDHVTGERRDLVLLERRVGRSEVDGLLRELLHAATGADRLVVGLRSGFDGLEVLEPLLVDRVRKRRSRARQRYTVERGSAAAAAGRGARVVARACGKNERGYDDDGQRGEALASGQRFLLRRFRARTTDDRPAGDHVGLPSGSRHPSQRRN